MAEQQEYPPEIPVEAASYVEQMPEVQHQQEFVSEEPPPAVEETPAIDYDTRIHELEAQVSELNKEISSLRELKRQQSGGRAESTTKSLVSVGDAAVFVSDIARGVEEDQLRDGFNRIAPVLDVHIIRSKKTGLSKGFGFVKFHSMDEVYKVLDSQNEWPTFEDKVSHRRATVRVQLADPKNVLYIVGIPKDFTYEQASAEVSQNGKVEFTKFDLATDSDGRSRGYGWITYVDHEAALIALRNLQNSFIRGMPMKEKVTMAEPRVVDHRAILRSKALFVKGLQKHVTAEMVEKLFNQGKDPAIVEKVTLPHDQIKHVPLGHAFVHFKTREDAAAAMEAFASYDFEGRRLQIEWCIPQDAKRDSRKRGFDDHRGPGRFGGDRFRDDRGFGGDRGYGGDRFGERDRFRDDRYGGGRDERPLRRPRYEFESGFSDGPRGPPRRDDYYDQSAQQQGGQTYGGGMGGQDFQQAFSANVGSARDALFSLASSLSRANGSGYNAGPAQPPAATGYGGYGAQAGGYGQGVQYPTNAAATAPYAQTSGYAQPPQQQYGAAPGFGGATAAAPQQAQYGAAATPQYGAAQYGATSPAAAQRPASTGYNPYAR
eukprot:TRINITY_DN4293_c0_g1_i1.p1 TRINITY_DN4293_c0_g1~~TRINITY_DN4293_c0_g1_i1.p1  ORF type:complete len:601 (-),score=118.02 TRINITY_DN4293_c0_g1_i1:249-2051(-)